jgi:hypothetical protein
MSKKFVLTDGQSGYEVIGEYIRRYWEEVCYTTVIVSVALGDDGDYRRLNIVASPTHDLDIEYLYDWWEGEKEIFLRGIIDVDAVYVNGGIFEPSERSRR